MDENKAKIVFWHRELPPIEADLVAEHTVEANSSRVPGTLAHRDELWDQCYRWTPNEYHARDRHTRAMGHEELNKAEEFLRNMEEKASLSF